MKTAKEMADYYRVTSKTFLRWVKEKRIPSIQVGRKYLFDPAVVSIKLLDGVACTGVHIDDPCKPRWFKVISRPEVGFGFNLEGLTLEYIGPSHQVPGDLVFRQPGEDADGRRMTVGATVTLSPESVEEEVDHVG